MYSSAGQISIIRHRLDTSGLSGEEYLDAAVAMLEERGFVFTGAPCSCVDGGERGHDFACGFTYFPARDRLAAGVTYEMEKRATFRAECGYGE